MSNYVKLATDAGDQYLAALGEMQDNFIKASSAFTARFTPPAPAVEIPVAFSTVLPTPAEVTEATFSFAQKLLKQQKSFAEKLIAASTQATAK
jgi:hypothetical protein